MGTGFVYPVKINTAQLVVCPTAGPGVADLDPSLTAYHSRRLIMKIFYLHSSPSAGVIGCGEGVILDPSILVLMGPRCHVPYVTGASN